MGKMKDVVYDKINDKLDTLQDMMESQEHISNPYKVLNQIASVSMYWEHLNDEEKDFVDCAKYAVECKMEWNI